MSSLHEHQFIVVGQLGAQRAGSPWTVYNGATYLRYLQ